MCAKYLRMHISDERAEGKEMGAFFQQFLVFAFLAGFGFMLARKGALSEETTNEMSHILMRYILPLTLFQSFLRPFDAQEALWLAGIMLFTAVVQVIYIILSRVFFGKDHPIDRYAVIFNNKAFVGIPIATSLFGPSCTFYISPSVVMSTLLIILYGSPLLDKKEKLSWKAITTLYKQPIFLPFFSAGLSICCRFLFHPFLLLLYRLLPASIQPLR